MNYLGLLSIISIAWCLFIVIIRISEDILHKYYPVKESNSVYSGGFLRGETSWRFTDGISSGFRSLKSDRVVETNIQLISEILVWVMLPAVVLYKLLRVKKLPHIMWSLLFCSVFWIYPLVDGLIDTMSRVEINFKYSGEES